MSMSSQLDEGNRKGHRMWKTEVSLTAVSLIYVVVLKAPILSSRGSDKGIPESGMWKPDGGKKDMRQGINRGTRRS